MAVVAPELERIAVDDLIIPPADGLYPREDIDEGHIRDLAEAIRAEEELPPIHAWRKNKWVADGVHRLVAHRRLSIPRISVRWHDYHDEAEFFEAGIVLNSAHGLKFTPFERVRIGIRARELGLSETRIAQALRLSEARLEEITVRRTAIGPDARVIPIKAAVRHLAGTEVSQEQVVAMRKVGGPSIRYHAEQLINVLEHGLIDEDDERLKSVLGQLFRLLGVREAR